MNDVDIAYAAGLFEGEGTVNVCRKYRARSGEQRLRITPQISLRIGMTDREPLQRMVDTIGGGIVGPYRYAKNVKPFWFWHLDRLSEIRAFAAAMAPFLSPRRIEQLARAGALAAAEVA